MEKDEQTFISSLSLENHPMRHVKFKLKALYCSVLEHIIFQTERSPYTEARVGQYEKELLKGKAVLCPPNEMDEEKIIALIGSRLTKWRKKYRYMLVCDFALILLEEEKIRRAADILSNWIESGDKDKYMDFLEKLLKGETASPQRYFLKNLPEQFFENRRFYKKPEIKVIVTANMSAGKSTLINALTGRNVALTSQEACTGNLCRFYSKPYEDEKLHMDNGKMSLDTSEEEIRAQGWEKTTDIALYFRLFEKAGRRIQIIDTPGVNSAVNKKHGEITKQIITKQKYDKVVYIFNGNKLGTDEEVRYLKWIHDYVPEDKMIFIVNKLDDYKQKDDSISESIQGVCRDLADIGYRNPVVCPLSAYFGYLLKQRRYVGALSEDEEDQYMLFCKKFRREAYDLSIYYEQDEKGSTQSEAAEDEISDMGRKCGLYGVEKLLFGGDTL